MFCKLFESESLGQILVKIDEQDHPEVRLFFQPEEMGVCSMALEFTDQDEDQAWDKAQVCFDNMTQDKAEDLVRTAIEPLGL